MTQDERVRLFKEKVSEKSGEKVLLAYEVENIFHRIGFGLTRQTINHALKNQQIKPGDIGINPESFGIYEGVVCYSYETIWQYLQGLNNSGQINLKNKGIYDFDQLIEMGYTERPERFHSAPKRRLTKSPLEDDLKKT